METLTDLLLRFRDSSGVALIHRTGVRRLSCTRHDLYLLSLRIASLLHDRGVSAGDAVVLWGANSPAWVATFFGTLALGAVAVPVDFMAGADRAATIASRSGAKLIVRSRTRGEVGVVPSLVLEDLPFAAAALEPAQPVAVEPDALAQIVYTSGTTGNPKGVMLTHRNLVANVLQVNRHIPVVDCSYRFLSVLPLSHMFEQTGGLLTPLYRGASIVYLGTVKPSAIVEALAAENISVIILVPRLLQMLRGGIERRFSTPARQRLFALLRKVAQAFPLRLRRLLFFPVTRRFGRHFAFFVSGGAALDRDLLLFWEAFGFPVLEGYGLTECSPVLTAATLEERVPGSVGKPLPGVDLRIHEGEIQARGPNVFTGYYKDPAATFEAFSDDGWFRSGDMGDIDAAGWLHLRGRWKEMIVTAAGVNVYPDDVEGVLNRVSGVREATVIGLNRGEGEAVHAVIIPDGSGRSLRDIVAEANAQLDPLTRITGFSAWPETDFPKTTTMKVRKFLVKERLKEGGGEGAPAVDGLVAAVARVTGRRPQEVQEDSALVADLALSSIGRLELVNELEQTYRLDLDDSIIGAETTVADVRRILARRRGVAEKSRIRPWSGCGLVRGLRRSADLLLHYPLFRSFVRLEVDHLERLSSVKPPVLFISNHVSYFDHPAIMFALPAPWRYRTATAAWEEFFFANYSNVAGRMWKRLLYEYATLFLTVFPLPQSSGFRNSLRHMGKLVDRGLNILVFPEGERSATGAMLPFRPGVGIMANELEIPVVPLAIAGMEKVFPKGAAFPRRGRVRLGVGVPLTFGPAPPEEVVASCREAVATLLAEMTAKLM